MSHSRDKQPHSLPRTRLPRRTSDQLAAWGRSWALLISAPPAIEILKRHAGISRSILVHDGFCKYQGDGVSGIECPIRFSANCEILLCVVLAHTIDDSAAAKAIVGVQ